MPRSQSRKQRNQAPEFFVDRALGRYIVPESLRNLGYIVHTMYSVYGEDAEEQVEDEEWLALAGKSGWIVLTKDKWIRRRPDEISAVKRHNVKMFCLTTGMLTGEQQAALITSNINRIVQKSVKAGPCVYGIYINRLAKLWPSS